MWIVRFSNSKQRSKGLVAITGEEVAKATKFCYLGSIIENNGEKEEM